MVKLDNHEEAMDFGFLFDAFCCELIEIMTTWQYHSHYLS